MNEEAFKKGFVKRAMEHGWNEKYANHVLAGLGNLGLAGLVTAGGGIVGHRAGNIAGDAMKLEDPENRQALKGTGMYAGLLGGLSLEGERIGRGFNDILGNS